MIVMGRRYLTLDEAEGVLRRGRSVEFFAGSCDREGKRGFRHGSISLDGSAVRLCVFETTDLDLVDQDITEWGPLNPAIAHGEADHCQTFSSLQGCFASLNENWPGSATKLVNEGMLQDEYRDYRRSKSIND